MYTKLLVVIGFSILGIVAGLGYQTVDIRYYNFNLNNSKIIDCIGSNFENIRCVSCAGANRVCVSEILKECDDIICSYLFDLPTHSYNETEDLIARLLFFIILPIMFIGCVVCCKYREQESTV